MAAGVVSDVGHARRSYPDAPACGHCPPPNQHPVPPTCCRVAPLHHSHRRPVAHPHPSCHCTSVCIWSHPRRRTLPCPRTLRGRLLPRTSHRCLFMALAPPPPSTPPLPSRRVAPPSAFAPPSTSHHALGASAFFIPDTACASSQPARDTPQAAGGGACGGTREAVLDCQWGTGPGCWWGVRVASRAEPAYTPGCCRLLSLCCILRVGLLSRCSLLGAGAIVCQWAAHEAGGRDPDIRSHASGDRPRRRLAAMHDVRRAGSMSLCFSPRI